MTYLVDTCVVSETTKPKPSRSVLAWLEAADPESLYLSVLAIGELERGIERLASGRRKRELRTWLEHVRRAAGERVLAVDEAVAVEWGRMIVRAEKRGESIPVVDALIGATAAVRGLVVVTRNRSDIGRTGVAILDPWSPD
jgi:predicted nucleic acid-binding protein